MKIEEFLTPWLLRTVEERTERVGAMRALRLPAGRVVVKGSKRAKSAKVVGFVNTDVENGACGSDTSAGAVREECPFELESSVSGEA